MGGVRDLARAEARRDPTTRLLSAQHPLQASISGPDPDTIGGPNSAGPRLPILSGGPKTAPLPILSGGGNSPKKNYRGGGEPTRRPPILFFSIGKTDHGAGIPPRTYRVAVPGGPIAFGWFWAWPGGSCEGPRRRTAGPSEAEHRISRTASPARSGQAEAAGPPFSFVPRPQRGWVCGFAFVLCTGRRAYCAPRWSPSRQRRHGGDEVCKLARRNPVWCSRSHKAQAQGFSCGRPLLEARSPPLCAKQGLCVRATCPPKGVQRWPVSRLPGVGRPKTVRLHRCVRTQHIYVCVCVSLMTERICM